MIDNQTFALLSAQGGETAITFKSHYINIHFEQKDNVSNRIIPYTSICSVDEEHLKDGGAQLRRINVHLTCGQVISIETNNSDNAEQILLHLLKNTIHPKAQSSNNHSG